MLTPDQNQTPLAYLNGEYLPFSEARLPVYDLGLVQGATMTERLRTVRHVPYLVEEHIHRLRETLARVGWRMPLDAGPIEDVLAELARYNTKFIHPEEDLSIVIFVTAGQLLSDANGFASDSRPTVCVYTSPLPLIRWAESFQNGVSLITPDVRQPPANVLSPQIKHRSRLYWSLADQQARASNPQAQALLLDEHGYVTETSSGNLFVVRDRELITPRAETTLPGIAQSHVMKLAQAQGWEVSRKDISIDDLASADEAFLTSSTYCLLPVSSINGRTIGHSLPGRVTKMLLDNWSEEVGLDLERQALAALNRSE